MFLIEISLSCRQILVPRFVFLLLIFCFKIEVAVGDVNISWFHFIKLWSLRESEGQTPFRNKKPRKQIEFLFCKTEQISWQTVISDCPNVPVIWSRDRRDRKHTRTEIRTFGNKIYQKWQVFVWTLQLLWEKFYILWVISNYLVCLLQIDSFLTQLNIYPSSHPRSFRNNMAQPLYLPDMSPRSRQKWRDYICISLEKLQ